MDDGLWTGPDSAIPNEAGWRIDALEALRAIKAPNARWPGGCFAEEYHWRDGVGPRDHRPRTLNSNWGGVETHAVGTHEFMDFCELAGCEPYLCVNVGSGSPQEMRYWMKYCNSDTDTDLVRQRLYNGRREPWGVRLWAIGNENWGCGGNMSAITTSRCSVSSRITPGATLQPHHDRQ